MKMNKIKSKVGKFWRDNKGMIIVAGTVVSGVVIAAASMSKNKSESNELSEGASIVEIERVQPGDDKDYNQGRSLLMTFSVEDTNEVLWKERCTENYMQDYKESGMKYEEVRRLNGLE